MKRILTVVCALLLVAGSAGAKSMNGGFGTFGPQVVFVNFDGLNSAFGARGFDSLGTMHWMFGGSGHAYFNRIVIGGTGWGGSQTIANDSLRAEVSISGGTFDIGYSVVSMKHLIVSPMLGIGGGGYEITLEPSTGDVEDFDDLLSNPGRTSKVSFTSFTLTPEIMVNVPIADFVGVQLRGGYVFMPQSPSWQLDDGAALLHGPAVKKGAPYVGLNVAFGGMGTSSRRHKTSKH